MISLAVFNMIAILFK